MKILSLRLGIKLFVSFLLVILVGLVILLLTARLATPRAYQRHFFMMEQQIGGGMMGGRGTGPGRSGPQAGMMTGIYREFLASFNESLLLAAGMSSLAAVLASIVISRGIARPVSRMMAASRRIAEGHYSERVHVSGGDELAELGLHFNDMAAQLEQVEQRRRELIGDVAHELRTPLTAIKGSMEGLIDGILPATPGTFEQIHREAGRLNRLVDDLQELSRAEAGASALDLQSVNLSEIIQMVLRRMESQFRDEQIRLEVRLPSSPFRVSADPDRIEQVLTNLLSNALQYSRSGGTVWVEADPVDGMARVSVRDNGIGIPASHLAHIFDRFYRVDKSRSRLRGGSGIGLTIARQWVENHGGRIWAESDGEGKGSRFIFTLPLQG